MPPTRCRSCGRRSRLGPYHCFSGTPRRIQTWRDHNPRQNITKAPEKANFQPDTATTVIDCFIGGEPLSNARRAEKEDLTTAHVTLLQENFVVNSNHDSDDTSMTLRNESDDTTSDEDMISGDFDDDMPLLSISKKSTRPKGLCPDSADTTFNDLDDDTSSKPATVYPKLSKPRTTYAKVRRRPIKERCPDCSDSPNMTSDTSEDVDLGSGPTTTVSKLSKPRTTEPYSDCSDSTDTTFDDLDDDTFNDLDGDIGSEPSSTCAKAVAVPMGLYPDSADDAFIECEYSLIQVYNAAKKNGKGAPAVCTAIITALKAHLNQGDKIFADIANFFAYQGKPTKLFLAGTFSDKEKLQLQEAEAVGNELGAAILRMEKHHQIAALARTVIMPRKL
ncbi:hypothetical protein PVAG01_05987 [Phlyctema vagabunda]|uniref:Uncharacterized protein n=1 Tax=Phlyctema vagabunda TaxID=108571 RepID=A0ABR4PES4_9HELO